MSDFITAASVLAAWVLTFALLTVASEKAMARSSGWTDLARFHRANGPMQGILYADVALVGRLGQRSNHRIGFTMVLADGGIALRLEGGLRPRFFPPLFLPWSEIRSIERRSAWISDYYRVRFASTTKEWRLDAHSGPALMIAWHFATGLSAEPPRGIPVPW